MSSNWNGYNPRQRGGGRARFSHHRGRSRGGSWIYRGHQNQNWNSNRPYHNANNPVENGPPGYHENTRRLRSTSYDNNNKYIRKQRTPSPLPGSEEYTQRNIQQTSNLIKRQLNIDSQSELGNVDLLNETNFGDPKISKLNSDDNEQSNKTVSVHQTQKKVKPSKSKRNSETIDVAEIYDKIITHISKLSHNKKMNLVNQGSVGYDMAIHQIQKQQRLELSRALRDMSNRATQDEDCEVINAIIPDIGIKIEDLPRAVIAKLSSTLNVDLDSNLVDPEECFKQAEHLLSFDDFVNFKETEASNSFVELNDNLSQFSLEPVADNEHNSYFDPYSYNPFSNSQSNEETAIMEPMDDNLYPCNEVPIVNNLPQESDIFSQLNLNTTHSYLPQIVNYSNALEENAINDYPLPEIKVRTDLCTSEANISNQKIKLNRNRIKKEEDSRLSNKQSRNDRKKHNKKQKRLKSHQNDSTYIENNLYKDKVQNWIEQLPDAVVENNISEVEYNLNKDTCNIKEKSINLDSNDSEHHNRSEYDATQIESINKDKIHNENVKVEVNPNDGGQHFKYKEKTITLNLINLEKLKPAVSTKKEIEDPATKDYDTNQENEIHLKKLHKDVDKFHRYERDNSSDQSENENKVWKELNEIQETIIKDNLNIEEPHRSRHKSRERRNHRDKDYKNRRSGSDSRNDADNRHKHKDSKSHSNSRNKSHERIGSNTRHDKDSKSKKKESGSNTHSNEKPNHNSSRKESSHHKHSRKTSSVEQKQQNKKHTEKLDKVDLKKIVSNNKSIVKDLHKSLEKKTSDQQVKNETVLNNIEEIDINNQLIATKIEPEIESNAFKIPIVGSSPTKSFKTIATATLYDSIDEDLDYELSSNSSCVDLPTFNTLTTEIAEIPTNKDKPGHSIVLELMEEFNKSMEIEKTVRKSRSLERTAPKRNDQRRFKSEDRLDAETYSNKFTGKLKSNEKIDEIFDNITIDNELINVSLTVDEFESDGTTIGEENKNMEINLNVDDIKNLSIDDIVQNDIVNQPENTASIEVLENEDQRIDKIMNTNDVKKLLDENMGTIADTENPVNIKTQLEIEDTLIIIPIVTTEIEDMHTSSTIEKLNIIPTLNDSTKVLNITDINSEITPSIEPTRISNISEIEIKIDNIDAVNNYMLNDFNEDYNNVANDFTALNTCAFIEPTLTNNDEKQVTLNSGSNQQDKIDKSKIFNTKSTKKFKSTKFGKQQKHKLCDKKQNTLINPPVELPTCNSAESVVITGDQTNSNNESSTCVSTTEKRKRKSKSGVKNSARPKSKQKKITSPNENSLDFKVKQEAIDPVLEQLMPNINIVDSQESKEIKDTTGHRKLPTRKRKCSENHEPIPPFKIIRSDIRGMQTVETQTDTINITQNYNPPIFTKETAIASLRDIDIQIDYLLKQRQQLFNQLCNVISNVKTEPISSTTQSVKFENSNTVIEHDNLEQIQSHSNPAQEVRNPPIKRRRGRNDMVINDLPIYENNGINEDKPENIPRISKRLTKLPQNKPKTKSDIDETIERVVNDYKYTEVVPVSADNLENSNTGCVEDKCSTKNKQLSIKLIRYDINSLLKLKDDCKIDSNSEVKQECVPAPTESVGVKDDTKLYSTPPIQVDFENWAGSILYIKVIDEVVLASNDRGIFYFFNLYSGKLIHSIVLSQKPITSFCIVKEEGEVFLYVGCLAGTLHVIKYSTYEIIKTINVEDPIQCMESSWGYIFMGSHKGNLIRYDIKKDILGESYGISNSNVLVLRACQEGARRVLLAATRNSPVTIRDAMTGLVMRYMEGTLNPTVYTILFHNNHVYCGTSQHDVLVYTFQDGQLMFKHEQSNTSGVVCMTIVNNLLFVGCYNGNIYVYNTKTNEFITSMVGPGGLFLSMEVAGDMIIAGTKQNHFRAWRMPSSIMKQMS